MRILLVLALGAFLLVPTLGAQTAPEFETSGSYVFGNPTAYLAFDACPIGATNGVDSSCEPLPAGLAGLTYALSYSDALDSVAAISVCFYGDAGFLGCDNPQVPSGATRFSVSSMGGVMVQWTLTVG